VLRTFFAIEIGEEARRAAAELVERLRTDPGCDGVRWTRPEAFHVTLRFLGPTGIAPFALALGALGAFPDEHRPRVLFVGVEPHEPLEALAAAVERGVVAAGFPPEERTFNGHLTLGRVRERRRRVRLPRGARCAAAVFPVASFVLMRSDPSPEGSVYTPLAHFALGGGAST
jgi:2'-5' RNA ligase